MISGILNRSAMVAAAGSLMLSAAGCGGKSTAEYSTAMQKVNDLFAQAMAEDRAASDSAKNPVTACSTYKSAADKLAQAAKIMGDLPAPDSETARSVGWTTASDTMKTQQAHLDKSIKQSCTS
jgi:sortase (surface protein transpeptidase)